jgi:hypothetical protein
LGIRLRQLSRDKRWRRWDEGEKCGTNGAQVGRRTRLNLGILVVDNMTRHILALGGDTVLHAFGSSVEIMRVTPTETRKAPSFDVDDDVNWLNVAPDGQSALIWGEWARRMWSWRAGAGHQLIAVNNNRCDVFGGGFAIIRDEITMFIAQHGVLRGFGIDGRERLVANLEPNYFRMLSITNLPGNRLALYGNDDSDPYLQFYTVFVDDLLNDPDSVPKALRLAPSINDRAWRLTVGPCAPDSAVMIWRSQTTILMLKNSAM